MKNVTPEILAKAQSWLSEQYDEETRRQVQNLIDNDPNELTESFYRICGNYDLRFDYADSVARFVGVIDRDMSGNYVLTILSDMEPRVLMLDIDAGGHINCEELGSGTMSYRESIDKTTIRFKGEEYICTLTK